MKPEEFIIMVEKMLKRIAEPTTKVKEVRIYTDDEVYHITKESVGRYHDGI